LKRPPVGSAAWSLVLLVSVACGGGTSPSAPLPAPTPAPSAAATPTPKPAIPGYSATCSAIGYGTSDSTCDAGIGSELQGDVEEAITTLITEKREIFDFRSPAADGGLRIADLDGYYQGVVDNLGKKGFCAARSYGGDNLQVKRTNAYSETFVIASPRQSVRLGDTIYAARCTPAEFPLTAQDAILWIRVAFYGIECPPGVEIPAFPLGRLPLTCAGYVTATPKDHNGKSIPSWVHGHDVHWRLKVGEDQVATRAQPEPFNYVLQARELGPFTLCAEVDGVEGCLEGRVIY
jgi:hypothetical protein